MLVRLIAVALAAAVAPVLEPGVYQQINPATKKPADPGNQIVMVRGKTGRLSFSVNAVKGPDLTQGFVVGTLPGGGRAVTWTQQADGVSCRVTFTALPGGALQLAQDARFGDCGFGEGVRADGTYVRAKRDALGAPPNP